MSIGDFRVGENTGWLEEVSESNKLNITKPADNQIFYIKSGNNKKSITVSGVLQSSSGKVLVIIRTDRDYPKALCIPKKDGSFEVSECTLGGVDHQIYAVLVDNQDQPILRSKVINVRLIQK